VIISIETGERIGGDVAGVGGEEKGFRIVSAGGDAPTRHETVGETGAVPDLDPGPDDAAPQGSTPSDPSAPQDAVGRLEPGRRFSGEDTQPLIELAGSGGKRSAARERFERRAEEIARAAEIGVRAMMEDEAKLFPPLVEERLPQICDERGLARGNAGKQPRRENADPGVEQGAWAVDAEGRDAVPFGLKRRVVLRSGFP
jgi:hypothetical protein